MLPVPPVTGPVIVGTGPVGNLRPGGPCLPQGVHAAQIVSTTTATTTDLR